MHGSLNDLTLKSANLVADTDGLAIRLIRDDFPVNLSPRSRYRWAYDQHVSLMSCLRLAGLDATTKLSKRLVTT
jgi:hypothetical protein